jgi:hypothetical protein
MIGKIFSNQFLLIYKQQQFQKTVRLQKKTFDILRREINFLGLLRRIEIF